jgi:hypothetical protein
MNRKWRTIWIIAGDLGGLMLSIVASPDTDPGGPLDRGNVFRTGNLRFRLDALLLVSSTTGRCALDLRRRPGLPSPSVVGDSKCCSKARDLVLGSSADIFRVLSRSTCDARLVSFRSPQL